MSTNDDEDSKNGSACCVNLIMFILTILVFANVNSLMIGITGCDLTIEYDYIQFAMYGTILSMVSYIILAIAIVFERRGKIIQKLCFFIIIGCMINQFYWMGQLWDAYPKSYLLFYNDFWTTTRSQCIDAPNQWVYTMMCVLIKIYGALMMLVVLCIPCCCCCAGSMAYFDASTGEQTVVTTKSDSYSMA